MKMTIHLIKYNLKVFVQNIELLFWMLFFPLFMMTIFGVTLGSVNFNIDLKEEKIFVYLDRSVEKMEREDSGNMHEQGSIEKITKKLSPDYEGIYKNYTKIFAEIFDVSEIEYSKPEDLDEATKALENGKALAIVKITLSPIPKISMKVGKNGTSEQILKAIIDEINQKSLFAHRVIQKKMENFYADLSGEIKNRAQGQRALSNQEIEARIFEEIQKTFKDEDFSNMLSGKKALPKIQPLSISGKTQKPFNTIVYALLGYSIFTTMYLGFYTSQVNRVDRTYVGYRIGTSGVLNSQIITSNIVVSMLISVVINIIVPVYGNLYFKFFEMSYLFDYALLLVVSAFVSNVMGMIFNFVLRFNENVQSGIMTFILLASGFASGMMLPSAKTAIDKVTFINKLNPVALISDSIYAIFEYNDIQRFWGNIYILLAMGIVLFALLILFNRRKNYEFL